MNICVYHIYSIYSIIHTHTHIYTTLYYTIHLYTLHCTYTGDIVDGNRNLNISFVAQLFEACNGLKVDNEKMNFDLTSAATLELDDAGDNREEVSYIIYSIVCIEYSLIYTIF